MVVNASSSATLTMGKKGWQWSMKLALVDMDNDNAKNRGFRSDWKQDREFEHTHNWNST